jgi:hypothetical protein
MKCNFINNNVDSHFHGLMTGKDMELTDEEVMDDE